jgi:hypothetical protein
MFFLFFFLSNKTAENCAKCEWPSCQFSCSDPSSLSRHIKRHVAAALANGLQIPKQYKKFEERVASKMKKSLKASLNLSSASPAPDVKIEVVSDSKLDLMESLLAVAEPSAFNTRFPVSRARQSQRIDYTASNDTSNRFTSGALEFQDQSSPLKNLQDEYSILIMRIEQLVPIIRRAPRVLAKGEIKGVISYVVRRKDGFDPNRFLKS